MTDKITLGEKAFLASLSGMQRATYAVLKQRVISETKTKWLNDCKYIPSLEKKAYEKGAKDEREKYMAMKGKPRTILLDETIENMKKEAFEKGKLAGRDEENKNWVETKAFLDNGKDEKIAALEAEKEKNRIAHEAYVEVVTKEKEVLEAELKCNGEELTIEHGLRLDLQKENARLRDTLGKILAYGADSYCYAEAKKALEAKE